MHFKFEISGHGLCELQAYTEMSDRRIQIWIVGPQRAALFEYRIDASVKLGPLVPGGKALDEICRIAISQFKDDAKTSPHGISSVINLNVPAYPVVLYPTP